MARWDFLGSFCETPSASRPLRQFHDRRKLEKKQKKKRGSGETRTDIHTFSRTARTGRPPPRRLPHVNRPNFFPGPLPTGRAHELDATRFFECRLRKGFFRQNKFYFRGGCPKEHMVFQRAKHTTHRTTPHTRCTITRHSSLQAYTPTKTPHTTRHTHQTYVER